MLLQELVKTSPRFRHLRLIGQGNGRLGLRLFFFHIHMGSPVLLINPFFAQSKQIVQLACGQLGNPLLTAAYDFVA